MRYVHFTDVEGARAIRDSGELWASAYSGAAVYAVVEGGIYVPSVQRGKLGRAKNRNAAVVFQTPELPDLAFPEEVLWHLPKIKIQNIKVMPAEKAATELLTGALKENPETGMLDIPLHPSEFSEEEGGRVRLTEVLFLPEAAIPFSQVLAEGLALHIFKTDGGSGRVLALYRPSIMTVYMQTWETTENLVVGMMHVIPSEDLPHKVYEVKASAADKGYGPVLYDIAMSYVHPKFLMADRDEVSSKARKVWEFMYTNRREEYEIIRAPGDDTETGNWDIESLSVAYRIKKKLPVLTRLVNVDAVFMGNAGSTDTREHVLTTLEEAAWDYFRDRMNDG